MTGVGRKGKVRALGNPVREEVRPSGAKCRVSGWPPTLVAIPGPGATTCHFPNHNLGAGGWGRLSLSPGGDLGSQPHGVHAAS